MLCNKSECFMKNLSIRYFSANDKILFVFGSLFYLISYYSIEPILIGFLFFEIPSFFIIRFFKKSYEYRMFRTVFSVCYFMGGITAIYAHILNDTVGRDSIRFFYYSTGSMYQNLDLNILQKKSEGSLAILIWRYVYNFLSHLGFHKYECIGTIVNTVLVAMSGVMSIRAARKIFNNDPVRLTRLILLYSCCGILILFSAVFLRDAYILFVVTALFLFWINFIKKQTIRNLLLVLLLSLISSSLLGFLRIEFIYLPTSFVIAGFASVIIYKPEGKKRTQFTLILFVIILIGSTTYLQSNYFMKLGNILEYQSTQYSTFSSNRASSGSLGVMILNLPAPVRIPLKMFLLFIYPIPIWWGFQIKEPYNLFMSLNGIYNFFFFPLLAVSFMQFFKHKKFRIPQNAFCLFVSIGYIIAVAATSGEIRHIGVLMAPMLLFALIPDLARKIIWINYKDILRIYLIFIMLIHILWLVLKIF